MKSLVTGGAGFIGSHLVEALLERGDQVMILDNLSSGKKEFLLGCMGSSELEFIEGDMLDKSWLGEALQGVDVVYHLAANPDIRAGLTDPDLDYRLEIEATHRLLTRMRDLDVARLVFASSSVVYGEDPAFPTPEKALGLPISMYGAGKLAGEAMINAWVNSLGLNALIFRFANVVGPRATHGILHDFWNKLELDPSCLEVLGDGTQQKSYLHVDDCVQGILDLTSDFPRGIEIFNLSPRDTASVREIVDIFLSETGLNPRLEYRGGKRGWPGDVPRMRLDPSRAYHRGWSPRYGSIPALRQAVQDLILERGIPCRR